MDEIETVKELIKQLGTMMEKANSTLLELEEKKKKPVVPPCITNVQSLVTLTTDAGLKELLTDFVILNPKNNEIEIIKTLGHWSSFGVWFIKTNNINDLLTQSFPGNFKDTNAFYSFGHLPKILSDKSVIYHKKYIPCLQ